MRELIKNTLPTSIINILQGIISKFNKPIEFILIKIQPYRHARALKKGREKKKVKVAFFVLNVDIWKYEDIVSLLEKDNRFEPVIVICPPINLRDEDIHLKMEKSYEYFTRKNHNIVFTYDKKRNKYIDVKNKISPDVVFFTNPYGYTLKKYRIKNFLNVLTCYAQYSFIMEESEHFFNKTFHNLLWKAFYETRVHKQLAERFAMNEGGNVEITGYPGIDSFVYGQRSGNNSWKNKNDSLKRIVWAPHWSVINRGHNRSAASNFLRLSEFMLKIAESYKDKIQIAFKPHPYLKNTLYHQSEWGKEKTESYYVKWEELDNGQLETGNYVDLLNSSDAMIFDSISFIAEYLYCGKPSMFIKASPDVNRWFNDFGNMALDHHYHGTQNEEIIYFIEKVVLEGNDKMKEKRDTFYHEILKPPNDLSASKNIYEILCKELFD